jgi:hypothetical protein
MANTFTDNRDRWIQMSEIDYLGQFVKAWLAFNAWYRGAYTETQDRKIIDEIKWNPNPISARLRPMLGLRSEEAEQFRTDIGLLHHRLERYEIHHGKGAEKKRIRLTSLVIRTEPAATERNSYRGWVCEVERDSGARVSVSITKPDGTAKVSIGGHRYDPSVLDGNADFATVTDNLKSRCRAWYRLGNPWVERDLTTGNSEPILCGTHQFRCGPDDLFAGVLEAVYLMRCSLFHGELVPTHEAAACYEPAFRIVRHLLDSVI